MAKIEIYQGDITLLNVDAIVNAANRSLLGGGGVDGTIHRAAGPELLKSCELLGGCEPGQAKITPGFRLPAKFVIHTVGPVWHGGEHREKELLASCYKQCLVLAMENKISTIAFPNISTGVYGFPKPEAAEIAVETVRNFLTIYPEIDQVIFCCFEKENFNLYNNLLSNEIMIEKVVTEKDILITANLADLIWNEHYIPIIGQVQVSYMIDKFQSPIAIENQIRNENYEYYIIYHQSEPSGYLSIKQTGSELFLSKFYVVKEKRGIGLGKKGFRFISGKAKELGIHRITLTVNKNNINSIRAYERLGFKNDGPVVADIGGGFVMDDFRMSYEI